MNPEIDITGIKFNRLTAIEKIDNRKWNFLCECGNYCIRRKDSVKSGYNKNCGKCVKPKRGNTHKDISGQKFNRLLAIRFDHYEGKYQHWLFLCECGKEKVMKKSKATGGNTKSCGCLFNESKKIRKNFKPEGVAEFNSLYGVYKNSAKRRELHFNLTKDEFKILTLNNCYYCDKIPSTVRKNRTSNGSYIYNGIDRVDNDIGYITTNVVSCCQECNYKKGFIDKNMIEKCFKFIFKTNV